MKSGVGISRLHFCLRFLWLSDFHFDLGVANRMVWENRLPRRSRSSQRILKGFSQCSLCTQWLNLLASQEISHFFRSELSAKFAKFKGFLRVLTCTPEKASGRCGVRRKCCGLRGSKRKPFFFGELKCVRPDMSYYICRENYDIRHYSILHKSSKV
jgi:hypothetical protein